MAPEPTPDNADQKKKGHLMYVASNPPPFPVLVPVPVRRAKTKQLIF